jgi:arginyl-tRNA synthetase
MNAHALVQTRIVAALEALEREGALPPGLDFSATEVAPPREAAHGELASNAAMVLAKAARLPPRAIAEKLAAKLAAAPDIAKVAIAGPGFVNLTFEPRFWQAVVAKILKEGANYGRSDVGQGARINIEYVPCSGMRSPICWPL